MDSTERTNVIAQPRSRITRGATITEEKISAKEHQDRVVRHR